MPKQPTEPLYAHKGRATISRHISIDVAGTTGRRNVSFTSNSILPASLPRPMSRDPNEFFPMPMDIDTDNDTGDIDGSSSNADDSLPALPGIRVVGKERAKRYTNSVRQFYVRFYGWHY
jgi:hypothetical protein